MRDSLIADDDIKFECSQCGQHIVVEKSAAGLKADCPVCKTPVTVPPADSIAEPAKGEVPALQPKPETSTPVDHAHPAPGSTSGLDSELVEARAEIARQHSLFKKAVDECERLNANATHIQAELKSFQADRQQLKADLAQARHAATTAETRVSELVDAFSALQQEHGAYRYQAEIDLNALHERVSGAEAHLAARETELQENKAVHTDALRSLARTRAEFTKVNTEAVALRSEVEALRGDFEATTQELASTSQQLHEVRAHLEALTEEHQQATVERDDWRKQAEGYRNDLSALDTGRDLLDLRAQHADLQKKHHALEIQLAEQVEKSKKENDVLRGIVERQNATLDSHHHELRRLRRARFGMRLVYGLFSVGMLALGYLAFYIFAPQQLMKVVDQVLGHH